jgi:hypothetical protein
MSGVSLDNPDCLSYRPSAYYFRMALHEADNLEDAKAIGFQLIRELEFNKDFARRHGLIPPRKFILEEEVEAKKLSFTLLPPIDSDSPAP